MGRKLISDREAMEQLKDVSKEDIEKLANLASCDLSAEDFESKEFEPEYLPWAPKFGPIDYGNEESS